MSNELYKSTYIYEVLPNTALSDPTKKNTYEKCQHSKVIYLFLDENSVDCQFSLDELIDYIEGERTPTLDS